MADLMVLGERLDDLVHDMQAMQFHRREDGSGDVEFTSKEDAPFFRALRRAEAEVILSGGRRAWNTGTRQHDAFLLVIDRLGEAADQLQLVTVHIRPGTDHGDRQTTPRALCRLP